MDRRVKYTKKIIKETTLSLLKEKDISKITISEICTLADINRATFYRYYLDIYDLLEKIEEEFILELVTATEDEDDTNVSLFLHKVLEVFLNNKELVKILFNTKNGISSLDNILETAYTKSCAIWKRDLRDDITINEMEFAFIFIFNGSLGVINYWIKNDFKEDIDDIASRVQELCYYGIKKFLYKK